MSTIDKLIKKVFSNTAISYQDVEKLLLRLGFKVRIKGSHHIFVKHGYTRNVSLKKRQRFLPYQVKLIREVLQDHGYEK